jgi:hypothetical protein
LDQLNTFSYFICFLDIIQWRAIVHSILNGDGNGFKGKLVLFTIYMTIDVQFAEWWVKRKGFAPISAGHVLPSTTLYKVTLKQAPRLWEKFINYVLVKKLGFTATTHERCLYIKLVHDELIIFLRQVDDFAIASRDKTLCLSTIQNIGDHLIIPLHQLGIIRKFNGVDILQTSHYVTISCESYIDKIIVNRDWSHLRSLAKPVPMRSEPPETADRPTSDAKQHILQTESDFP